MVFDFDLCYSNLPAFVDILDNAEGRVFRDVADLAAYAEVAIVRYEMILRKRMHG